MGKPLAIYRISDELTRGGLYQITWAHDNGGISDYSEARIDGYFHGGSWRIVPTPTTQSRAADLLDASKATLSERAVDRDETDERAMAQTVTIFNTLYGHKLTEVEGWMFMTILKMVRGTKGPFNLDDYLDQVNYTALACEAAQTTGPAFLSALVQSEGHKS
jgi:hypothetical protein